MNTRMIRLTACALCCVALLAAMRPAFAQQANWDSGNALDVAEGHEYWRRWWLGYDAGGDFTLLGGFTFTHHPDSLWALLKPPLDLFEKLYADRLSLVDAFNHYGVFELVRDDPAVLAQFREYTTTRELTTDTLADAEAYQKHLLALLDAMTTQEHFTLGGGVDATGTILTSQLLEAKQESAAFDMSADAPSEPSPFKDLLHCCFVQNSRNRS